MPQRRHYYERLARGLADLPNGRPLSPVLPAGVVPYMFPFLIDQPESVFPALKRQGVPIYRWEDLATDVCAVSNDYARRLLQLPCHPELRESEVDWIMSRVRDALRSASADASPVLLRSGTAP
jgi:dTDP-4-amino-4,6-dideoxygalactose transaminase